MLIIRIFYKKLFIKINNLNFQKFNPFRSNVAFNTETSHLIRAVNQMTGLYMKCDNGLKWVKEIFIFTVYSRNNTNQ